MRSTESAQQPQAGTAPIEVEAGDSPTDAPVPFWITACVRLQPPRRRNGQIITASLANAVFPAVQALIADRIRTVDNQNAPLNRDRIARRGGLGSAKKAGWLFDYLQQIGFLRIQHHYAKPGRGRGEDTFTVFIQPPPSYVGPRTHAELEHALDDSDQTIAKVLFIGAGQGEGAESGTFRADQGAESGTLVSIGAGQGEGAESGTFSDLIDSSPRRRGEESIEPVPGGSAMPPATGLGERQVAEVRTLVRRLPWNQWAKKRHGTVSYQLKRQDADDLEAAICTAMTRQGITLEQAADVARHALVDAHSPVYVVRAFEPARLREWLGRLEVVELSDDPLPLPVAPASSDTDVASSAASGADEPAPAAGRSEHRLDACDVCRSEPGERYPSARTVTNDEGREARCPRCFSDQPQ